MKLKSENSGLNGIRTHGLCNKDAVLYQLSHQAIWELIKLGVSDIPVKGKKDKWIYERWYIWTVEKDMKTWLIIADIQTNNSNSNKNDMDSLQQTKEKIEPNTVFFYIGKDYDDSSRKTK